MADLDQVPWNVDLEVSLFHAIKKHKPVGVNRHFQMAFIYNMLNTSSRSSRISCKQIWEKLGTLYDLRALNESEIMPFPNKPIDFTLPDTEFSPLMSKVASSSKSPIARHDSSKEHLTEKEVTKEKDSHREKEKDRDGHRDKDRESHKDKERHTEKDRDHHKERDSHRDKESHKDRDRDSHKERESLRDRHEREKESKSEKKSRKDRERDRDRDRHRDRSSSKSKRDRDHDQSPKGSRKRTRNIPEPVQKVKEEGAPTPKRARRI